MYSICIVYIGASHALTVDWHKGIMHLPFIVLQVIKRETDPMNTSKNDTPSSHSVYSESQIPNVLSPILNKDALAMSDAIYS